MLSWRLANHFSLSPHSQPLVCDLFSMLPRSHVDHFVLPRMYAICFWMFPWSQADHISVSLRPQHVRDLSILPWSLTWVWLTIFSCLRILSVYVICARPWSLADRLSPSSHCQLVRDFFLEAFAKMGSPFTLSPHPQNVRDKLFLMFCEGKLFVFFYVDQCLSRKFVLTLYTIPNLTSTIINCQIVSNFSRSTQILILTYFPGCMYNVFIIEFKV